MLIDRSSYRPVWSGPIWKTLAGILLMALCSSALGRDIRFLHYTSADGLPSNELYALAISQKGYLWIGSKDGLTRFDGLNFESLLHSRADGPALPGRSVQYLLIDTQDRLWVSLEAAGLAQINANLDILQHFTTATTDVQLPDDNIWSMAEGCDGEIWLGFAGAGIARFNPDTLQIQPIPLQVSDPRTDSRLVNALHVDSHCRVWAGLNPHGLFQLDESQQLFVPASGNGDELQQRINSITHHENYLYATTSKQVLVIDSTSLQHQYTLDIATLSNQKALALQSVQADSDRLWVASNAGVYSFELFNDIVSEPAAGLELFTTLSPQSFRMRHYQTQEALQGRVPSNNAYFLITSLENDVWVATLDNGLVYKPPGWNHFKLFQRNPVAKEPLPNNDIKTIHATDSHLWIGTNIAGVAYYNYLTGILETPTELTDSLPIKRIRAFHSRSDGSLWISGTRRLFRYLPGTPLQEIELPADINAVLSGTPPFSIIELSDTIWFFTLNRYVFAYYPAEDRWSLQEINPQHGALTFNDTLQISPQQYLLAAEQYLYLYDAITQTFTNLLDADDNPIQQIAFDNNDYLWIAQKNHLGQYELKNNQLSRILTLRNSTELRNATINNFTFDAHNQIWLGSLQKGLFKMLSPLSTLSDNTEPVFLNLTDSDGLSSNEMKANTFMHLSNGNLSIASNQGLIMFDPDDIKPNRQYPVIDINHLDTLELHLKTHQITDQTLRFDHDDNTLSIGFNALVFNNRDKLIYQYRLDGWDDSWITTTQIPQVTYSRLKHGHYTFQARARVANGDWGKINRSLQFSISRPPWITWWAYTLYALVFVLLSLLLWRRQRQAKQRRMALYQARERQHFAETQTRIATDFARAIHYEEIANTLSATLREAVPLLRLLVHFRDEQQPAHVFSYTDKGHAADTVSVDFKALYTDFENNPQLRHHQMTVTSDAAPAGHILSLPLGAKRPVQAIASLHFPVNHVPDDNEIAMASLVAQTAETAVHNTILLEQVSQLAALNQRANEAKSEFISTVSHEIRTPLHGLMGMLDLLNNDPEGPQRQTLLKRLTDSSEQLLSVVDDVLDISKIEASKLELSLEQFDITEVISHATRLFHDKADAKNLYLHGLLAANTPHWWVGDRTRLLQVLSNLINNSIKFTEHGGILLCAGAADPSGIRLIVADSGVGMDAELIDRLFDQYHQADNWTWKKYGGSGLGLAITNRLVELMGGEISVTSELSKGSQFDVFLPLTRPEVLQTLQPLISHDQHIIHLACGQANRPLQTLLQTFKTISCTTETPVAVAGNGNLLITDSLSLSHKTTMPVALLQLDGDDVAAPVDSDIRVFRLTQDWQALLAWIYSQQP